MGTDGYTWWKEVTDWKYPNHTYILNQKGALVAYIKEGSNELIELSTPMTQFSKSRRKFKKVL